MRTSHFVLFQAQENGGETATIVAEQPQVRDRVLVGELIPAGELGLVPITTTDVLAHPEQAVPDGAADALWEKEIEGDPDTRELMLCKMAAHQFLDAFQPVAPLFDASERAEQSLTQIPVAMARNVCREFRSMVNRKEAIEKMVAKYNKRVDIASREMLELYKVPESLAPADVKTGKASALSVRLQSFAAGRYWLRMTSDVRQALNYDLPLTATFPGTSLLVYRNVYEIKRGIAPKLEAKREAKKAAKEREEEGNGTGQGQALGEGSGDKQTLKLPPEMPQPVHASLSQVMDQVAACRESKDGVTAVFGEGTLTITVAHVLNVAALMIREARYGRLDGENVMEVVQLVRAIRDRADDTEGDDAEDLADLEEVQHELATHELPSPEIEGEDAGKESQAD